MSAAQIRTADPANAGTFFLGRFSPDFKAVESYVLISGYDTRRREVNGNAWIAGEPADIAPHSAPCKRGVEALLPGTEGSISILNAAGRPIARVRHTGRIMCTLDGHPAGVYIVKGSGVGGAPTYRTFVKR
jgi:hypothetical protein